MPCAQCCPRTRKLPTSWTGRCSSDPRRYRRPAQCRKIHVDQPFDRGGSGYSQGRRRVSRGTQLRSSMPGRTTNFGFTTRLGLRRRSRVEEKLGKLSVADALNAVRFAEVVVVLLDVENAFEEQDQRIADMVEQEKAGRSSLPSTNGIWKDKTAGAIGKAARAGRGRNLLSPKACRWLPSLVSPREGLDRLSARQSSTPYDVWNKRIPTSGLATAGSSMP